MDDTFDKKPIKEARKKVFHNLLSRNLVQIAAIKIGSAEKPNEREAH